MYFQTRYRLDPWSFDPPLDQFGPFRIDVGKLRFSLWLECTHGGEDKESELLIRTLHERRDVPEGVLAVFQNDSDYPDDLVCDADGFSPYPSGYREFVIELHEYMDRTATELFNTLRWRYGLSGGPLALTSWWASLRWHDERCGKKILNEHGFLNRQIPTGIFTIDVPRMQDANACRVEAVRKLSQEGITQPLYHELLREAWQNKSSNPRSALVMGIAAAETAVKTTAADLSGDPGMAWILQKSPSPPLVNMLREYIPLLPARLTLDGEVRRPPGAWITTLRKGVELRNGLVHGRTEDIACDTVTEILMAVRDVLYLLDYYRGQDWALGCASSEFLKAVRADPK